MSVGDVTDNVFLLILLLSQEERNCFSVLARVLLVLWTQLPQYQMFRKVDVKSRDAVVENEKLYSCFNVFKPSPLENSSTKLSGKYRYNFGHFSGIPEKFPGQPNITI